MPFQFSLETLLRIRRSFEHRERQNLALLVQRLEGLRAEMRRLESQRSAFAGYLQSKLAEGMKAGELQFATENRANLAQLCRRLSGEMAQIVQQQELQRRLLQEARQKRQVLEDLRDHQFEAYRLEQNRREQQRLDDLYLAHRANAPGNAE